MCVLHFLRFNNIFRMYRVLLFLLFLKFSNPTAAQNPSDTLELQLSGLRGEKKLDLLIKAAKTATKNSPEKTIHYASRAMKLAGELNNMEKLAESVFLLSDGYLFIHKPDSALFFAEKSLEYFKKAAKREGILKSSNLIGLVFLQKDDFFAAEKTFVQTFNECNKFILSGEDEGKVKDLAAEVFANLMATYIRQGNYKKAKEKLLQFSKKRDYGNTFPGMIIHGNLATIYQMLGQYDSSLVFSNRALAIAIALHEPLYIGTAYSDIGNAYYYMGRHTDALQNYEASVEVLLPLNDKMRLGRTYNNMASVYKQISYYEKATSYYLESARLKEELADSTGLAATYNNLGLVYTEWENPKMAEKYLRMSVSINLLRNNKKTLSVNYTGLGDLYLSLKKADSALFYYEKSLALKTEIGHKYGIVNSLHGIGNVYSTIIHDDLTAEEYYRKALTLAEEIGSGFEIASLNQSLGEIYFKKKNWSAARGMFEKTLSYATREKSLEQIQKSCQYLTEVSIQTGDKTTALACFSRYRTAGDSIFKEGKTKAILEMQTRFETQKKEQENLLLSQMNKYQQTQIRFLAGISAVLLLLGLIIFYLLRQKSKAYRLIVKKNLEILHDEKRMENRKNLLKNQPGGTPDLQHCQGITNTTLGLLVKLSRLMDEEKPYLETGITIEDFCRKLNTNRTYLSQLINENFHQNFNTFINDYRIKEARRLLAEPKYNHISIEGIGSMVGFTSKVTFHSAFKHLVGVTPSYFRKSVAVILNDGYGR